MNIIHLSNKMYLVFGIIVVLAIVGLSTSSSFRSLSLPQFFPLQQVSSLPSPSPEDQETINNRLLDKDEELLLLYSGRIDHIDQATTDLEEFVVKYPQNARARALLGLAHLQVRQPGLQDVEQALEMDPGNLTALRTKINFWHANDEPEIEQEAYQELIKYHPDNVLVNLYQARSANHRQDYKKALEIVSKELETKQMSKVDLQLALLIKEFALEHLNRYDEADQAYAQLTENSHGPWNYQSYAIFLIERKHDYVKAIEIMKKGLDEMDFLAGEHVLQGAYFNQGKVLYEQQKYEEAMEMFDKAVEAYPYENKGNFLSQIASYYRQYGTKTHNDTYIEKAKEVTQLLNN